MKIMKFKNKISEINLKTLPKQYGVKLDWACRRKDQ